MDIHFNMQMTAVVCSKPNNDQLNSTQKVNCRIFTTWIQKWKMKANCSRTDRIWFQGCSKQLEINEENLTRAQTTKALGITLDYKLNFERQNEETKAAISKKWNMLHPFITTGFKPKL